MEHIESFGSTLPQCIRIGSMEDNFDFGHCHAIDNFRFVDNWYSYSVNLVLAQILHDADGRCLEARLW